MLFIRELRAKKYHIAQTRMFYLTETKTYVITDYILYGITISDSLHLVTTILRLCKRHCDSKLNPKQ